LLEKLKGYVREKGDIRTLADMQETAPDRVPDYLQKVQDHLADMRETVQALTEIGSTNIVQFFLDNITWRYPDIGFTMIATTRERNVTGYTYGSPFGNALMKCKDVPLQQCMDALARSREGTLRAYMLEVVTRHIHGKDFLREVKVLAEESPDVERWEAVKGRLESNTAVWLPPYGPPLVGETPVEHDGWDANGKEHPMPNTVSQLPVTIEEKPPNRVPVTDSQPLDEPDETKTTPWKISLLIGIIAFGAIGGWCYFRKKG